jgi:hypothetical protein
MNDLINDIEKLQKVTDTISKRYTNGIFMLQFMPLIFKRFNKRKAKVSHRI